MASAVSKNVPLWLVVPVIGAACLVSFGIANSKAEKEANRLAGATGRVWTRDACSTCHSRIETIRLMQSKRDDPNYAKAELEELLKYAKRHPETAKGKPSGW